MTGSLISSLVIGQRNSQGIPAEKESLLSSSTLLHSLFRRPTDSAQERNIVTQNALGGQFQSWKNGKSGYTGCCNTKNNSSPLWRRPLLSTNSCRSRLHPLLSLHSTHDSFFFLVAVFHCSVTLPLYAAPSSPTQPPCNFVSAMKGAINVTQLKREHCAAEARLGRKLSE